MTRSFCAAVCRLFVAVAVAAGPTAVLSQADPLRAPTPLILRSWRKARRSPSVPKP